MNAHVYDDNLAGIFFLNPPLKSGSEERLLFKQAHDATMLFVVPSIQQPLVW